jgi:hypothetical protein
LRGDGVNNWDFSIAKETPMTERLRTIFEAEFLNAFNRTQFASPGRQQGSAQFGVVTGVLNNPRQIQFALRVLF